MDFKVGDVVKLKDQKLYPNWPEGKITSIGNTFGVTYLRFNGSDSGYRGIHYELVTGAHTAPEIDWSKPVWPLTRWYVTYRKNAHSPADVSGHKLSAASADAFARCRCAAGCIDVKVNEVVFHGPQS